MLAWFLARKYLFASRSALLRTVSIASAAGVALGVATLIVVLSVNNGFLSAFRGRILDVFPHLVVMKRFEPFTDYRDVEASLLTDPAIAGASHVTYDEMMLSAGGRNRGVRVKGVAVASPMYQEVLAPFLEGGTLHDLEEAPRARADATRVHVTGLVQGGVYHLVLHEREGALVADLFDAESTAPGPAACRVRAHVAPGADAARAGALAATTTEGHVTELPLERGVDLDSGPYTVVGAFARGALDCRAGTRVLLWAEPGRAIEALPQPRWERSLHRAQILVDSLLPHPVEIVVADDAEPVALPAEARGVVLAGAGEVPRLFVGVTLAESLDVSAGDEVTLLTPLRGLDNRGLAPFGMAPTAQRFRVMGTIRTDFHEFDQSLAVTSYRWMTRFQNQGDEPRWVEVRLAQPERLEEGRRAVRGVLEPYGLVELLEHMLAYVERARRVVDVTGAPPPDADLAATLEAAVGAWGLLRYESLGDDAGERFRIVDWEDMNRNLFSSLTLQKVVLALFFLIIVVIASFTIVSTQLLLLTNKLPDVAILRSMGARQATVRRIFGWHGLVLASTGVLGGLALGVALLALLDRWRFPLDPAVYLISYLPVDARPGEIALIAGLALLFAAATVRLGSRWAASRNPLEALRSRR